jgi:hypothetical protein
MKRKVAVRKLGQEFGVRREHELTGFPDIL